MYRIGLDIGSTTAKLVVLNEIGTILYKTYRRHKANVGSVLQEISCELKNAVGDNSFCFALTGSVALGLSERAGLQFVQEVVATTEFTKQLHPEVSTIIDIGGEDAKIVYLRDGRVSDLRMNGNCAGGTGAFIDQMAMCLGVEVSALDGLAKNSTNVYPIASRCGVFSKTDVQNLIAQNVCKEDIAASIFRAVAVQTASALSHGCNVRPMVMVCGGPLSFIPQLKLAVADYFGLNIKSDFVQIQDGALVSAFGAALCAEENNLFKIDSLLQLLEKSANSSGKEKSIYSVPLPVIFKSENEYSVWKNEKAKFDVPIVGMTANAEIDVFLGIDSGSTTTKIVLTNKAGEIICCYYAHNDGDPIGAVRKGLQKIALDAKKMGAKIRIVATCSTGYGEDLMRAAFSLDYGIIETMAHYLAARLMCKNVSFILDIGGQDMKAIYVKDKILTRIEINEACSSGCGSFIETFAQTLGCSIEEFAQKGCFGTEPCDLGTRCTVFMNSKVKQALREGHSLSDISAGLAYSVVKNCLFKVLKIKNYEELGAGIVLQGGTMKNDSVVRAFENLSGRKVYRNNIPEAMGAYGCALYAANEVFGTGKHKTPRSIEELLCAADYKSKHLRCSGCENKCQIAKYIFKNGESYFSGNKCERIFTNGKKSDCKGRNLSGEKNELLFNKRENDENANFFTSNPRKIKIGIPRVLNMFEEYPFWYALFTRCGFSVILSAQSTISAYEKGVHSVMSDNICFPAKLVHGHIYELEGKVDRIFFPRVVYERPEDENVYNSFNCPIIIGYPDVVDSAMEISCPIDSPIIAFKDEKLLRKQLHAYLNDLGVDDRTIDLAILYAMSEWEKFDKEIREKNQKVFESAKKSGRLVILLAGRPYHTDPLVQHGVSDMIASFGVDVITEEIGRNGALELQSGVPEAFHVRQWTYVNRILNAAQWVSEQGPNVHFVEITSFGCGPDAFLTDEVRAILARHGKPLTLLKVDDVNNIGSLKLRVRSLIDSLALEKAERKSDFVFEKKPFVKTAKFLEGDKKRKTLLAPFFTEYMSPLLPAAFKAVGYNLVALPMGDAKSNEEGLRYSNNEVCYPATIIVGDFIKALKSGKYDLQNTALCLTQMGQCRATNYPALIKRALVEAGFEMIPVISIGGPDNNEHPGFKLDYKTAAPIVINAVLFGDWISVFYHATAIREIKKGEAKRLRKKYLRIASMLIANKKSGGLVALLSRAAVEFNLVKTDGKSYPKAGIAGEIFLKFNSFSHKHISDYLMAHGVEVCPPTLHNYFLKILVNIEFNRENKISKPKLPKWAMDLTYIGIYKIVERFESAASKFKYYIPEPDIRTISKWAEKVLCLSVQSGEGWLLPAETISYIKSGCNNVVSLQPFGCIANHIAARGIEKKLKELYPQLNYLALDYDGGVSEANIANRLQLFISNMSENSEKKMAESA